MTMHTNMTGGPTDRPRQPKEHRLKIDDNPYTNVRWFTCSCGCPIGGYSLLDLPQIHSGLRSQKYIRVWEKHRFNPRYDALGPTPKTVTIWIEPLKDWATIPWRIYVSGFLVIPRSTSCVWVGEGDFDKHFETLNVSPAPGNPLIWR